MFPVLEKTDEGRGGEAGCLFARVVGQGLAGGGFVGQGDGLRRDGGAECGLRHGQQTAGEERQQQQQSEFGIHDCRFEG